jgi:hypothetical protein
MGICENHPLYGVGVTGIFARIGITRIRFRDGEWGVGGEEWGVGSGEWGVGSGEWGMKSYLRARVSQGVALGYDYAAPFGAKTRRRIRPERAG